MKIPKDSEKWITLQNETKGQLEAGWGWLFRLLILKINSAFKKYSWNLMQACSKKNMGREGTGFSLLHLKRLVFSTKDIKTSPIYFTHKDIVALVEPLSLVWLFVMPWTAAHQAPLSPGVGSCSCPLNGDANHLILCHPLLLLPSIFPSIRVFSVSQFFTSGGQNIGASASASVLPMNIQCWFPLGLTGLISLESKGLSRVFSRTTIWKHQGAQPSLLSNSQIHNDYWKSIA